MDVTVQSPPQLEAARSGVPRWPRPSRPWRWSGVPLVTLFAGAYALLGWALGIRPLSDNSFLWHLRTGHWILSHAAVPRHDLYSFTVPRAGWVAQSWLAEVCYAAADNLAGGFGIRLVSALLGAFIGLGCFLLAWRIVRRRVRATLVVLPAVLASVSLWVTRPLLFGLACLVALLWVVEVPDSFLGRRPAVVLPVVLWVWANVHGTFVLGFGYLALFLVGRWLEGSPFWRGRERQVFLGALLAAGCCLVNPYGWKLLAFPFELMMRGQVLQVINEWQSPNFRSQQGVLLALWIAVLISLLALARRRPERRDLLVVVPFLLLALWAQRNILLSPVIGIPMMARLVVPVPATPDRSEERLSFNVIFVGVLVLASGVFTWVAGTKPSFDLQKSFPVEAMKAVQARGFLGHRLMTTDAWAGYVIYRYWPRQRVFLDDRYDMYPVSLAEEYFQVSRGEPSWSGVFAKYNVDLVVWPPRSPLPQYLATAPGWTRIYEDPQAVVFAKTPPPLP